MSRPRKPGPAREKPVPPKNSSSKPPPEELARDAITLVTEILEAAATKGRP